MPPNSVLCSIIPEFLFPFQQEKANVAISTSYR